MASEMTNTQPPAPGVAAILRDLLAEPDRTLQQRPEMRERIVAALQASAAAVEPVGDMLIENGRFNGFGYRKERNLPDGQYKLYTAPPLPAQVQAAKYPTVKIEDGELVEFDSDQPDGEFALVPLSDITRGASALTQEAEDAITTLSMVCDVFSIGSTARTRSTILQNVENARRRSDCLWGIEHEFFMVSEPDEDEPDGEPFETCLLNWGHDRNQYVKRFGELLASRIPAPGMAGGVVRVCGNESCGWSGHTDRMCGSVGPLCPECGETTEPDAAPHPAPAQQAAGAEPLGGMKIVHAGFELHGYRQGTGECIAFSRGVRFAEREHAIAAGRAGS